MDAIFGPISSVIEKYSYGPCTAIVVEVNSDLRCCCVKPQNHYFLNHKGEVIVLLPMPKRRGNLNGVILKADQTIEFVSTWSSEICQQFLKVMPSTRFTLFYQAGSRTIIEIVNKMLTMGIFQLR